MAPDMSEPSALPLVGERRVVQPVLVGNAGGVRRQCLPYLYGSTNGRTARGRGVLLWLLGDWSCPLDDHLVGETIYATIMIN